MDNLTNRIAVVTGAGDGIGRGIAIALAEAGAHIAIADIDTEAATRVATELTAAGHTASPFHVDVADPDSLTALAEEVRTSLGPASILCNNAGVMLDGPLTQVSAADWQWILDVNLHGVIKGVRAFIDQLRAAAASDGFGAQIVNTGSMAGLAPRTYLDYGIYSASKAAVVSYSENLRAELEPETIGVSVLCPSTVSTRIWEADRNRPAGLGPGRPVPRPDRVKDAIDGNAVGQLVLNGIRHNRAYIFTSDDARPRVEERHAAILADIERHETDSQ
ncbi:MAG: SDR family NAD(P)-dependent oxidoreductase [Dehalococcoidia bacterium]|jgi:NAD(P)-dependent dehydrogenase (short-subunit alcohol dehydrogenase family)|nr:SDR family NAD(P)-dependent oxidoreductase [Dehalococcoidia bacterium]